jgi:hypothetical protein
MKGLNFQILNGAFDSVSAFARNMGTDFGRFAALMPRSAYTPGLPLRASKLKTEARQKLHGGNALSMYRPHGVFY